MLFRVPIELLRFKNYFERTTNKKFKHICFQYLILLLLFLIAAAIALYKAKRSKNNLKNNDGVFTLNTGEEIVYIFLKIFQLFAMIQVSIVSMGLNLLVIYLFIIIQCYYQHLSNLTKSLRFIKKQTGRRNVDNFYSFPKLKSQVKQCVKLHQNCSK
jgi:hypothetical protein